MLAANKMLGAKLLAANKIGNVKSGGGSKCVKPKIRSLESQKLSKSKKRSKTGNTPKFDTMKNKPSFLTPKARATFNHLRLAFIKAPIL